MKVLFITNIPAPYRMKFFEGLGEHIDLTVLYEAKKAKDIKFSYEDVVVSTYKEIYLSDGYIHENIPNPKIITFLLRNKFDLIFLNNYRYATEMLAYICLKVLKTPYCIEIDGGRIKKESKITYGFKRWLLDGAIAYFSPAKSADAFFTHYGVNHKKIVRYPFTSVSKDYIISEDGLLKKIKERKDKALTFLYVGRIIPEKGLDILINAYNVFCSNINSATKLLIVGNASNSTYLSHLNIIKNSTTEIRSFASSKELVKIYDEADVFVFPSMYDPWGLVINEAMARGLIIVSSNKVNSSNELIKHNLNGFIFDFNNLLELNEIFAKIQSDKYLRKSIGRLNLDISKKYTIEEMTKVHHKVIENL